MLILSHNHKKNYIMIFNKIKTVLIIGLLTLFITNAHSQSKTDTTGQKNIYPEKYTFKQAKKYVRQKEYENAIWFYINIYPENKTKVIKKVKALNNEIENLPSFIKFCFMIKSMYDPTISYFDNGEKVLNSSELNKKRSWVDELILKLSNH